MVLSNKKLKQKLREAIAESLFKKTLSNSTISNPETPKSIKQLLDSATQKPSLSKREKRRKTPKLPSPEEENKVARVGETEIGKGKKRKREKKSDGVDVGEDLKKEESEEAKINSIKKKKKSKKIDGVDVGEDLKKEESEAAKINPIKKKKKKKHKHKKKGKGGKLDSQSNVVEIPAVVQEVVPENVNYDISQATEEDTKKVYVGGIPFYSTEDDIRSFFDHCGTIIDIDCMMFPESGKFRGIAMISFKTKEAAKRALALDGSDMGGLFLKIQPYKSIRTTKSTDFSPPVITGYNRVYAGNLSWDITEEDLKRLFSDCKISAIRFGEDKETGEFKGYAHVDFADHTSLTKALELDQSVVCGRPVRIRCAVPVRNPGSTNPVTESTFASVEQTQTETLTETSMAVENETSNVGGISSGKLKRRTCYECGEKGHISSDCPIKQAAEKTNPVSIQCAVPVRNAGSTNPITESTFVAETVKVVENETSSISVANNAGGVSSGKLKRRTCYECGEKGHISSDCPKKQAADKMNP